MGEEIIFLWYNMDLAGSRFMFKSHRKCLSLLWQLDFHIQECSKFLGICGDRQRLIKE